MSITFTTILTTTSMDPSGKIVTNTFTTEPEPIEKDRRKMHEYFYDVIEPHLDSDCAQLNTHGPFIFNADGGLIVIGNTNVSIQEFIRNNFCLQYTFVMNIAVKLKKG